MAARDAFAGGQEQPAAQAQPAPQERPNRANRTNREDRRTRRANRAAAAPEPAQPAPAAPATRAAAAAPAAQGPSLEFDLPAEFSTRAGDGTYAITGFRVGVFQAGNATPIRTSDVSRDAVKVTGKFARVPLPELPPAAALKDATVRVQTLSRGQQSEWSEPVSLAAVATAGSLRLDRQPQRQKQDLTVAQIDAHPMLAEALRKLLGPQAKLEDNLKGFQKLEDLAILVAISRDNDIPFTTLRESVQANKGLALRRVLRKVRPQMDVRGALNKARPVVREFLGTANKKKAK